MTADKMSLSDELDADELSPYRRRQRVVPVRRTLFSRLKHAFRSLLFAAFLLLPTGYMGYRAAIFALTAPQFTISSPADVGVEGNRCVSNQEVLAALGLTDAWRRRTPVNIFRFSLGRGRKAVESIPWVRSASMTRAYPHRVIVRITERVPVAFVSVGGRLNLVDGEGVLLDTPEKASFDFPVVSGLDSAVNPAERRLRLDAYEQFLREVAAEVKSSGWVVSEVNLSDDDDLKATVFRGDQTVELHLGHADFEQRFRNFLSLLAQVGGNGSQIDSMDLRYGGQVVVNPRRDVTRADPARPAAASRTRKE